MHEVRSLRLKSHGLQCKVVKEWIQFFYIGCGSHLKGAYKPLYTTEEDLIWDGPQLKVESSLYDCGCLAWAIDTMASEAA